MTVHRVGPTREEAPPHRTDLGRVLVTIDDLKALIDFLIRDCERRSTGIKVEFDGGDFTEPEDLRTLSDVEMRSLRLKSSKIEVVLNPSVAFAVGDRQEAEDVYRLWARRRQTRLKPHPVKFTESPLFILAYVGSLIGLTVMGGIGLNVLTGDYPDGLRINVILIISIFIVVTGFVLSRLQRKATSCYAVIIPRSLAEHRQELSSLMYPRRSWIVAIVAAIIAAAAVGVAVWAVLSR